MNDCDELMQGIGRFDIGMMEEYGVAPFGRYVVGGLLIYFE